MMTKSKKAALVALILLTATAPSVAFAYHEDDDTFCEVDSNGFLINVAQWMFC